MPLESETTTTVELNHTIVHAADRDASLTFPGAVRVSTSQTVPVAYVPTAMKRHPAMLALSFAQGWVVLPLAAAVAASVFGQVTVNDTMTARYISPALRAQIYSVRFFVCFLGSAAAAPVVSILYERTGSVAVVITVLAVFSVVTLGCALFFPDRQGGTGAGAVGGGTTRRRRIRGRRRAPMSQLGQFLKSSARRGCPRRRGEQT